ncbi:lysophospholipase [Leptospira tipperaryensis]|uniref:Lysophospholipase n=1 Tax=Leptospira tipperaryensis TaxID=2564040 RepID=A0A1D7V038_9LEPT|nr:alpha/beta hydrolase [Leptospira tipperaryensis]AOP35195.1 lysophospholipase [Leptospira tipperaryensis]
MKLKIILIGVLALSHCGTFPPERGGSYLNTTHWQRYQKFLPESLKLKDGKLPKEEYWVWKKLRVHLDRYENPNSDCKVLLIHGGGGNGRVLGSMAKLVFDLGCEVIAPDLPGFGLTLTDENFKMDYNDWVQLLNDLIEAERKSDKKMILFGLSIGGMLAYHVAAENGNVQGLIVTTLADLRRTEVQDAVARNRFLRILGIPLTSWLSWITDDLYVPIRWLSKMELITNDPDFSKVFSGDPYAGGAKVSFRWMRTISEFQAKIEPDSFRICPILLVHPELDPWTPLSISRPFFDRIPGEKKFIILEGAGHFPYEEPGLFQLKNAVSIFIHSIL